MGVTGGGLKGEAAAETETEEAGVDMKEGAPLAKIGVIANPGLTPL
jgi:hypothetical protein